MKLFGYVIWPWHSHGKTSWRQWTFIRNAENGFTLIVFGRFFYTTDPASHKRGL